MDDSNEKTPFHILSSLSLEKNPSDTNKPSSDVLPSWITFHLKSFAKSARYCASVIMDHYLIILVHGGDPAASLLAFDLLDHSVQEAEIDARLFAYQEDYNFIRYGENQILKYDGENLEPKGFVWMTVESFKPFEVSCELFEAQIEELYGSTAQVYKDCMYVYGKVFFPHTRNELWSFDLKEHTWKFCATSGEEPKPARYLKSLIFQDSLVVYGGSQGQTELFLLDLNSMKWTRVQQQEKFLGRCKTGGVLYKDHLVFLKDELESEENTLCCLDLHTKNTWSTFEVKGVDILTSVDTNNLVLYNGLLFAFAMDSKRDFILTVMNLDNLKIFAPESAEGASSHSSFLSFMNENESDIAFKVQGQLIPAHKRVLLQKSRFFENLLKSGMVESRQDVIEIEDCEYEIFKEYLRFIYQGTVDFSDINRAIKLYAFSDKYVQDNLQKQCLNYIMYNINDNTVYRILDFANEENIPHIRVWCLMFFKEKLTVKNVAGLIEYLAHGKEDSELRNLTVRFVLGKFFEGNMQEIYEAFLIKNITIDTILPIVCFLSREPKKDIGKSHRTNLNGGDSEGEDEDEGGYGYEDGVGPISKSLFEKSTVRLKEAAFNFVQENAEIIMESKFAKDLPREFMREFILYTTRNFNNLKAENQALKNERKRMEPSHNGLDEDIHVLKKTKK